MAENENRVRIFKRQSHAFMHVASGSLDHRVAACPLCFGPFGSGDVHGCTEHEPNATVEHAPPKQRNRLGVGRRACLTHRDCNAHNVYETQSGRHMADLAKLRRGEEASLWGEVDGRRELIRLLQTPAGVRAVDPALASCQVRIPVELSSAAQLTELKAAYLIAFSVLGYSWAAQTALDPVRKAIQKGDVASIGRIPLFMTRDPDPELANTVLVCDEEPVIAVIGDDPAFGALLANGVPLNVGAGTPSMSLRGYAVPWLAEAWWSRDDAEPFRWDCTKPRPRFLLEAVSEPA